MTMTLKDTVELMTSEDYSKRLRAELLQAEIRYEKLYNTIVKYDAGILEFEPEFDIELLRKQLSAMREYIYCLDIRAATELIGT